MNKAGKAFVKRGVCGVLMGCLLSTTAFGVDLSAVYASGDQSSIVDLEALKVIEIYSRATEEGKIETDYIPSPREIDEYHRMGLYGLADVPYSVSELRLEDAAALNNYPLADTKQEALAMAISDEVYNGLKNGQAIFFTGADGDTAVGVAGGMRRAYPNAKLGMVYMDASGNIQSVAAIMGVSEDKSLWELAGNDESAFDALLFTDGRDLDSGSGETLDAVEMSASYYDMLSTDDFKDESAWSNAVDVFADEVDAIYLHIDADFLHQGYISHMDTGAGEGPDIWTMMDNLQTVMETGKVAAINLASMYSEDPGYEKVSREPVLSPPNQPNQVSYLEEIWQARGYQMPQYHEWETEAELINRLSTMSIRTAIRMVSTMLGNWTEMPEVPGADLEIPAEPPANDGNVDDLKVIEILTRTLQDGIFVGRNLTLPQNTENPTYEYEERGNLIPENDHISPYTVPSPREIDDFRLAGLYDLAGVPVEISAVDITEEEAEEKYPELAKFEALCKDASDEVYEGLMDGKAVFLDAMGCPPGTGIAGGIRRAFGNDAKLGIIYIDAHGDINTCDSTKSGGVGGMDLAPIMGIDPHPTAQHWWNSSSDNMEPFDELLHCCANNLDSGTDTYDPDNPYEFGEMINIQKSVSDEEFIVDNKEFSDTDYFAEVLADFASKVDVIYLHIDMDYLDNSATLNSGSADCGYYSGRPGPDIWTSLTNIEAIMDTGKVAVAYVASVTSNSNAGMVNDATLYRRGYDFPDVADEVRTGTAEDQVLYTNRISSNGILQGMRVTSTILGNWENQPQVDTVESNITLTIGDASYSVNGKAKELSSAPVIVSDRTMVPVDFFADAMGGEVTCDIASETATITLEGKTLTLKVGELLPGMDVPAYISNGQMMVPAAYIAQEFGAAVYWDGAKGVKIIK